MPTKTKKKPSRRATNNQTEKVMLTFNPEELKQLEVRRAKLAKQVDAPLPLATMLRSMVLSMLRGEK